MKTFTRPKAIIVSVIAASLFLASAAFGVLSTPHVASAQVGGSAVGGPNFFKLVGTVITPVNGSWTVAGASGSANTIANGKTATTTGGVTGGVEYFDGSIITNNANLTTNGSGALSLGGTSVWTVGADAGNGNQLTFSPSSSLSPQYMVITQTGKVGIGSTTPNNALDVNGYVDVNPAFAYRIANVNVLYASSTAGETFGGQFAGANVQLLSTSTDLTSGPFSTAFGYQAMQNSTTTAYRSTAMGYQALKSSANGSAGATLGGNSAFGYQTLTALSTGYDNTAVGLAAGSAVTSGTQNTLVGSRAGQAVTGSFNTFVGMGAGQSGTAGSGSNVGIGISAAQNVTGANNVAVGANAMKTGTSATENVILGRSAGVNLTGNKNVVIGSEAASTTVGGNQNITIGYDIALPTTSGSNLLDIGNLIFGTGLTSEASGTPAGSVGIASSSPTATLGVAGTVSALLTTFATGDGAVCQRGAGGFLTFDSGVSSCIVSSQFVKHDIAPIAVSDSTGRIMALKPVSFVYNDTGKPDIGVTAEAANAVDPRYAQHTSAEKIIDGHTFAPGDPMAPNWSAITADLVAVVQSQQTRLDAFDHGTTPTSKPDTGEDLMWAAIGILALGFVIQQIQISRLKRR